MKHNGASFRSACHDRFQGEGKPSSARYTPSEDRKSPTDLAREYFKFFKDRNATNALAQLENGQAKLPGYEGAMQSFDR